MKPRTQDASGDSHRAWSEGSTAKRRKGVATITRRFSEKCSMQGPPYIHASTFWWSRAIWTVMLLCAMAAMTYHLYYLCKTYFDYPVKNTITLGFESLQFPAVTVCNVNPIKQSKLNTLTPQFQKFVDELSPDRIGGIIDLTNTTTTNTADGDSASAIINNAVGGRRRREQTTTTNTADSDSASPITTAINNAVSGRRRRRQTEYYDDEYYDDYAEDYGDESTNLDGLDIGIDTSNYSGGWEDVDDSYYDEHLDGYSDSWEKEAPVSAVSKLEQDFQRLFSAERKNIRREAGHSMKDMLISCSFAGKSCYARNFTLRSSMQYGNCYTLQYDKFFSRSSGPAGGLELILFLDTDEYNRGVTPSDGLQVSIHPQRTMTFPVDDGLAVAAGTHTMLPLRLVQIERKGYPYSVCTDNDDYLKKYKTRYTRQMCQKVCQQTTLHTQCNCRDETEEVVNEITGVENSLRGCRSKSERECLAKVYWGYQKGQISCACNNPCLEFKHDKKMSFRYWPHTEYARNVLVKAICKRDPAKCATLQAKDDEKLSREFVKLSIFYEDLNYENITEGADYESVQFVSDVGGTLGLWIGLSVLSIIEVVQYLGELARYLCCCRWRRHH